MAKVLGNVLACTFCTVYARYWHYIKPSLYNGRLGHRTWFVIINRYIIIYKRMLPLHLLLLFDWTGDWWKKHLRALYSRKVLEPEPPTPTLPLWLKIVLIQCQTDCLLRTFAPWTRSRTLAYLGTYNHVSVQELKTTFTSSKLASIHINLCCCWLISWYGVIDISKKRWLCKQTQISAPFFSQGYSFMFI